MSTNSVDKNAIYYEIKPRTIWLVRIVNLITVLMILIAVISCFVQGHKNKSYYLLVANLILSGLVYVVVNWWYKTGDLGSDKFWFVLVVCVVIIFQCISTDAFVFKVDTPAQTTTTAPPPFTTDKSVIPNQHV